MSISDNDLAAYADGQLGPDEAARVEQALAADPALAEALARHRALKAQLAAHFALIAQQPVPERLAALLQPAPTVIDFAEARAERASRRAMPRWGWVVGPALAATLAIAVFVPRGGDVAGYADARLAGVLDSQLAADQPADAPTRVLLSFNREGGDYCRVYASAEASGIACRDESGWALVEQGAGVAQGSADYRQAGSATAQLLATAQAMATDGGALDAAGERAARARGWRD